jgi:hypothetical protein
MLDEKQLPARLMKPRILLSAASEFAIEHKVQVITTVSNIAAANERCSAEARTGVATDRRSIRGLWIKVMCPNRKEFVVVGWTDPEGGRPRLGVVLGYYDPGGRLIYGPGGRWNCRRQTRPAWHRLQPLATDRMTVDVPPLHRVGWVTVGAGPASIKHVESPLPEPFSAAVMLAVQHAIRRTAGALGQGLR